MTSITQFILKSLMNTSIIAGILLSMCFSIFSLFIFISTVNWIFLALTIILAITWMTFLLWVESRKDTHKVAQYIYENSFKW